MVSRKGYTDGIQLVSGLINFEAKQVVSAGYPDLAQQPAHYWYAHGG